MARHSVLEHQCAPYTLPYMFFGPNQFRIWEERHPDTQELIAIQMYLGTYQQRRTIWMDGRPHPPEYAPHTFMGFSTGEWNGDILTITTTHIKAGYFRRTGVPQSDRSTVVEHWMRHGNLLSQVTIASDPVYLTEPYIRSQEFVMMERGNTNWLYNCEYVDGGADGQERGAALPARAEPVDGRVRRASCDAGSRRARRRGDAAARMASGREAGGRRGRTRTADSARSVQPSKLAAGEVKAVHVQGNVHMIVGAGANIAVQVGDDGILVVDTGAAGTSDKVLAAIKALAPDKEIRWMVNTTFRPDHTGGNEPLSKAGRTVNGNIAAIVAHENVAARMIKAGVPDQRPSVQHLSSRQRRDFPFNGEPVVIYHPESANTDAESMVMFRRSDVIVDGRRVPDRQLSGDRRRERRHHAGDDRRPQPHSRPDRSQQDAAGGGHLRHPRPRPHQRRARRGDVSRHGGDHPRSHPRHGRARR